MPNIKSSIIDLRKIKKRTAYNRMIRSRVRTLTKQLILLLDEKDKKHSSDERLALLRKGLDQVYKAVDKATQKGVLKKNTAARKKSSLARRVGALQQTLQSAQSAQSTNSST